MQNIGIIIQLKFRKSERKFFSMKRFFGKKSLSAAFAGVLLLLSVLSVYAGNSVSAQSSAKISNTTVVVTVSLPENPGLATLSATLSYDANQLEYDGIAYKSGDTTATNTETVGKVGINAVWAAQQTTACTLAEITFQIKPGAQGAVTFPVSVEFATNADNEPVDVRIAAAEDIIPKDLVPAETKGQGASSAENTDAKNPNTAGVKYAAIGTASAVALAAVGVLTGTAIKRKKS